MSYYYVTHPNSDFSATVSAPTTDKARTTFLDYLERTGRANRKFRQNIRRHLIAERIEAPEEVEADVNLSYSYINGNYAEEPQQEVAFGELHEGEEPLEEGETEGQESKPEESEEEPQSVNPASESPIGRLATGQL